MDDERPLPLEARVALRMAENRPVKLGNQEWRRSEYGEWSTGIWQHSTLSWWGGEDASDRESAMLDEIAINRAFLEHMVRHADREYPVDSPEGSPRRLRGHTRAILNEIRRWLGVS